jgi:ABC-type transport system substrate-binding protein
VLPPATTSNSFLFPLLHSGGRWNIAAHEDDLLDRLIERQASEFDEERRQVQLLNIQHRVLDQAYLVSTVTRESRWVHNRELRDFQPNTALSEYIFWSRVWLDRSH